MTASTPTYIVVDANTALHFKRPEQIDWCALTGANTVILVGAPILHRELEYQKIHNPSRKLRDRAAAYIKWLAEFVRDPSREVRSRTTWLFLPFEPQIDFLSHKLSTMISDDQLIASVIEFAEQTAGPILVATADVGLEVKLRYRKIAPLLMPDDMRLPEEADPQEKELLDLRRRLAQQRAPVLALLTGAEGPYPFELLPEITAPSAPSLQEIRRKHPLLIDERSAPPKDSNALARFVRESSLQSLWLTPERIQGYNKELQRFFAEYRSFLDNLLLWEQEAALTFEVALSLSNSGTAPASDIDVMFTFPAGIIVLTEDSLTAKPEPPQPPERPEPGFGSRLLGGVDIERLIRPHYEGFPVPHVAGLTSVTAENNRVNFWLEKLKHGTIERLESVFIKFPKREAIKSFSAEYKMSAAELPTAIADRLHFVLT